MENKRGNLFLGIIGVATLLVAIIGATFAYFSATAGSNEDAIQTSGAALSLEWWEDATKMNGDLIPVEDYIAIYGATDEDWIGDGKQCLDENSNYICGIYDFGVSNSGKAKQDVFGKIIIQDNTFSNLRFAIYKLVEAGEGNYVLADPTTGTAVTNAEDAVPVITGTYFEANKSASTVNEIAYTPYDPNTSFSGDDKKVINLAKADATGEVFTGLHATLEGTDEEGNVDTVRYRMIIWIHETGTDQTSDDGLKTADGAEPTLSTLVAGISFTTSIGGNTGVTGIISAATKPSTEPEPEP